MSSAKAVASVKRLLPKGVKIGHTGTLDPMASGLLVVLLGRATRLSRYVTDLGKSYTATARLGAVSDTLDAEGEISELEGGIPTEDELRAELTRFRGEILQTPPMASAVKVGGERLYEAHRRGETVEREAREATVHGFELTAYDPEEPSASFEISCGGGTYVRTLVADLAGATGSGAGPSGDGTVGRRRSERSSRSVRPWSAMKPPAAVVRRGETTPQEPRPGRDRGGRAPR